MKRTKEESEFSKVTLTDPLGEYKHVEKVDLEEQKLFENKLSTRDQKGEEDNKSQAPGKNIDPKKKKKVVFDDVSLIFTLNHFSGLTLNYSTLKFTKSCTKTSLRGRKTMIILGKTLRIKTSASECSQKAIGITGETVKWTTSGRESPLTWEILGVWVSTKWPWNIWFSSWKMMPGLGNRNICSRLIWIDN